MTILVRRLLLWIFISTSLFAGIRPVARHALGGVQLSIQDRGRIIFQSLGQNGSLKVIHPGDSTYVCYTDYSETAGTLNLTGGKSCELTFSEMYRSITPDLIERTVTVKAGSDQRYFLDLGWHTPSAGTFYSFLGEEKSTRRYTPSCSGPEFPESGSQTFPFLGCCIQDTLYGLIGDTPGLWENRSFMTFDAYNRTLSLCNGDGSAARIIMIPFTVDATTVYRGRFDGWQHIEQGETQTWKSWIFTSPASRLYDIQLAAHLALANAKGFHRSAIEAILRNTSYLLLRRNLLRPESDYLFISGVGYGWKQWVTDGFYMSRGLDDSYFDRRISSHVQLPG